MVDALYDLIVIGGGVVGLAVLRAATLHGWKCALVEAESELLSQASGSNSGIACTGVDASPGTLERSLIRDANSQFRLYCQKHNIPTRPCGSLVALWPEEFDRLDEVLAESHDAGDTHAKRLSQSQVLSEEPNISSLVRGAVHIPGEIVVDPWLYSISLGVHARENGAHIFTNFCVDGASTTFHDRVWTLQRKINPTSDAPRILKAKCVVNAAGIFADLIQGQIHGTSKWTAKPRRGQYRLYNASPSTMISHPIQPVPSQVTKGIFVFSTLYNQLVVGPTAEDQDSRTDRKSNADAAHKLDAVIKRIIPELDSRSAYVGEYVGIRPGTDRRDYQIHLQPKQNWIAVAGIRSTGLTASLGIGNYVVRLASSILEAPTTSSESRQTTPLPSVSTLIQEFHERKDGRVVLNGHAYKVTHPLTRLGWESATNQQPSLSTTLQSKL